MEQIARPHRTIRLGEIGLGLTVLLMVLVVSLSWVSMTAAYAQNKINVQTPNAMALPEVLGVALVPQPPYGQAPLTVAFSARVSGVQDAGSVTYRWDFGDGEGAVASPQLVTHTYSWPGSYVATAIVTTADGRSAAGSAGVIVTP